MQWNMLNHNEVFILYIIELSKIIKYCKIRDSVIFIWLWYYKFVSGSEVTSLNDEMYILVANSKSLSTIVVL